MLSALHIDWLSLTFLDISGTGMRKAGDIHYWNDILGEHFTRDKTKWRVSKPMFGYKEAYQSASGTIVMYGTDGMGLHVIYGAQALQALNNDGTGTERIVKNAVTMGARATRVDIALDIYDGQHNVSDYERDVRRGAANCAAKTWRVMAGSEGGHTLYLGSRYSERLVRIYDKKAERASVFVEVGSNSWIRAEVELKGEQARGFLVACKDNALDDVMLSHLIAAVDFPTIKEWREATKQTGRRVEPTQTKRKDTKTRHWLMSTIAPIMAREAVGDRDFLSKFMNEVYVLINKSGGKPV